MTATFGRPAARRCAGAATEQDGGFTVVEVVVAFLLFVVVSTAAIAAVVDATKASHGDTATRSGRRPGAAGHCAVGRRVPIGHLPKSTTYTAASGAESFAVQRTVAFVGSATACSSGNAFSVHVAVMPKSTTVVLAQSDTVVAC